MPTFLVEYSQSRRGSVLIEAADKDAAYEEFWETIPEEKLTWDRTDWDSFVSEVKAR